MSNAAKHRKKAAEFEQLKQIDRAIASYVKAIEESETTGEEVDVALFNKVGDLALRQGRVTDAITYYERAVEHYATAGLFNNAIALCNKILRNAPGRANVYFTLGRISARKGLRGDATRNFLEYATRMQQEGRIEEGIRALAEVLDLMPELSDVRVMVEELAERSGIALPRRRTPLRSERIPTPVSSPAVGSRKSGDLVYLDVDYGAPARRPPVHSPADTDDPVVRPLPVIPTAEVPTPGSLTPVPPVGGLELTVVGDEIDVPGGGLETDLELIDVAGLAPVAGFTPDEQLSADEAVDPAVHPSDVTWILPPDADAAVGPLDELVSEDFQNATSDPGVVRAIYTATPLHVPSIVPDASIDVQGLDIERLHVEPVPELDAAISAARRLVDQAAADEERRLWDSRSGGLLLTPIVPMEPPQRPPFRLDPHEITLPGELPPLRLDDRIVARGLGVPTSVRASDAAALEEAFPAGASAANVLASMLETLQTVPVGDVTLPSVTPVTPVTAELPAEEPLVRTLTDGRLAFTSGGPITPGSLPSLDMADLGDAMADAEYVDGTDGLMAAPTVRPMSVTPSLPTAVIAETAGTVASSRSDSLRAAVARFPRNWLLRRRLAEGLFEAGARDEALVELETAQRGLVDDGEYGTAWEVLDELVHVSPDREAYHQFRVDLAKRTADQQRLRLAYLDFADSLLRVGDEARAREVYERVLEIDPHDDRARAALGAHAPPPEAVAAEETFVDLGEWLRNDDEPLDTRMRMQEPVISGDEQADFEALLRHFKEGVSRSLGEDDFESHYDLGVAFKEMGLLDDAVAEFQKALRSQQHRLPAYEALGQCFVEQERYQVAVTVLERALDEADQSDDQRVGVLYLLGVSCEALQRNDEARGYFQRVYATDINFRDVAARLAALEQVSR